MIQAVIFDVGGVLLRTYDWSPRHKWDDRLGLERGTVEHTVFNSDLGTAAQLGQVTVDAHWANIGRRFGLSAGELAQLRHDFWAGDRFDYDLVDAIRRLKASYKTAIISNAFDDLRAVLVDEFEVADAFDVIVISAEEHVMKPDAEIYRRALARLGCEPQAAVFIDDSPKNVVGARHAGLHAIHFTPQTDLCAELSHLIEEEMSQ